MLYQKSIPSLTTHSKATPPQQPPTTPSKKKQSNDKQNKQLYNSYMKTLIASNAQYFQSKLKTDHTGRPREYRFKMPCGTGSTIYRKHFKKNNDTGRGNNVSMDGSVRNNASIDVRTNNFVQRSKDVRIDGSTTYQKDYRYRNLRTQNNKSVVKQEMGYDQQTPRFFDTQNKIDFLNWSGRGCVSSMKPHQVPATTPFHFDATSTYKTDFKGRAASPTPIFTREASFPKLGCMPVTMMRSCYGAEFGVKKCGREGGCRPKDYGVGVGKGIKGVTEYKREFIKGSKQEEEKQLVPTLEQLQTLIIDL